jgi:uncharacterized membrane protein YhaH (DUF805 family)
MFKHPFLSEGRIRRTEYGLSYLIIMVIFTIFNIIIELTEGAAFFLLPAYIPLMWFGFAQGAKRCHDRGNSAWFQFIPFYHFWLLFADSNPGENCYGPNPKGIGNQDEIMNI